MKIKRLMITCLLAVSVLGGKSQAQDLLSNVYGRDYQLLNGKWGVIVDLYDQGERMQVYKNRKPQDNKQFYEYSFDGGLVLNVPADFNSQMPELKFYEGTVWYGRSFDTPKTDGKRLFLYFGAVYLHQFRDDNIVKIELENHLVIFVPVDFLTRLQCKTGYCRTAFLPVLTVPH